VYSILREDHQKVKKLFGEFQKLHDRGGDSDELRAIAEEICSELTLHARVEEELFYPALRERLEESDLLDEAKVEHESAKMLIEMIENEDGDEEMFAARVIVLGEYVNHHIEEEQRKIFPAAKKTKIDAVALGEAISRRKEELKAEMGLESADEDMEEFEEDEEAEAMAARAARGGDGMTRPAHR
jgi:hemerythrin